VVNKNVQNNATYTVDSVWPWEQASSWIQFPDWHHWCLAPWPSALWTKPTAITSSPLHRHSNTVAHLHRHTKNIQRHRHTDIP